MNNSLVSVNLTTYNRAHLLHMAIDSILAQTYKNLEINIVDDCSSDNTFHVVKRYQGKDKRINYYRQERNKGNAFARNIALKNSKGYYIAFIDDDDWWIDPKKISKQVDILKKNPSIGIVCSNVRFYKSLTEYEDTLIKEPDNLKSYILSRNGIIHNSTVMTRKSVLDIVGGFDENKSKGIDSEFYRNCIVKYNYGVYFMSDITTAYKGYGEDRMTPVKDLNEIRQINRNQFYLLWKYKKEFVKNPKAIIFRLQRIFKISITYLLKKGL